ncbi:MAG: bifunctional 5,10-methylenetetrahydrofolate dehydrogenase/5,10-methenyltetrahydrofolate cyclohydrolase [Patescibacteria group bacterium]
MKLLNGLELVEFIKERQAHAVRALRQSQGITPKLLIIRTNPDPVVDSYMKLKSAYGEDILVDVEVRTIEQSAALTEISAANQDESVHGIIVQIPLPDSAQTDEILNSVVSHKDVDGLSNKSDFDAPTPIAINWLLAGYNVDLRGKNIVIVGHGRLVGKPLTNMWQNSELDPKVVDKKTQNLAQITIQADILICATGVPSLISAEMVKSTAVIVDAGVATDKNGFVGDVSPDVRQMPDIKITPEKGGVGPLTVAALFENVIQAARGSKN